jgi:phenylacetate-CoA ligase
MIYDSSHIQRVYRRSPTFVQNIMVSGYGMLKRWEQSSASFTGYIKELNETQWWSGARLRELQDARLRALIRHAYEHVPYYRRVFDERGLQPADIATAEDLYKLPVLTKQDVRQDWDKLRARNIPASRTTMGRTGGTTGVPLKFALDKERVIFDRALIHRLWSWAGFQPGDLVVLLRGFPLIPPETSSGVYWRHDWADHRIYLSGFHLSPGIMPRYVEMLKRWKPKFVAGYPSNIFTLARFLELQREFVPVEAVFTSSEVLTPVERKVIEKRFVCKVWDRYGTGERLVVGQQCEQGSYHQNAEFGILQIDRSRGKPAANGQKGELIQTSLTNLSMPFIRYATEDMGWAVDEACPCGRGLPLMGPVEGRKDDVIVTADGRIMPRAGLDQIHEFVDNLERCQLMQEKLGEVVVRVLPRPGFGSTDASELIHQLEKRLGKSTQVRIEIVDRLNLTTSGKERFIVSRVQLDEMTGFPLDVRDGVQDDVRDDDVQKSDLPPSEIPHGNLTRVL